MWSAEESDELFNMPLLFSHAEPGEGGSLMTKTLGSCIFQLFGEMAAVVSVLLYVFSLSNKRTMPSLRQGISGFKEVQKASENS